MKFEGIYTPAVTTMTPSGEIDKKAYANHLEKLVAAKVHGIVIAGSTGEYYAQTMQERLDLAAYAKDVIGSRLPLIVGTGATRTEDAIEYAKGAREIGASAILVTSPPYALPTAEENAVHALKIDQAAGLPIMLYNYPARMGVSMDATYFDMVVKSKNVVAIKESSGDMNTLHLLACHYPQISLSCGWDDQALEFFAWGAKSWVCAGSNFIPAEHIALYEACVVEKDFAKGRKIMKAMMPLMDFLESGKFVQSIKFGCEVTGQPTGPVRAPLGPLTAEEQGSLRDIVKNIQTNVAKIVAGASE